MALNPFDDPDFGRDIYQPKAADADKGKDSGGQSVRSPGSTVQAPNQRQVAGPAAPRQQAGTGPAAPRQQPGTGPAAPRQQPGTGPAAPRQQAGAVGDSDYQTQRAADSSGIQQSRRKNVFDDPDYGKEPGILRSIADTGVSAVQGLVRGAEMVSSAIDAGSDVSKGLRSADEFIGGFKSGGRRAEQDARAYRIREAEKSGNLMDEIKAYGGALAEAPIDTTVESLGTAVPAIAASVLTRGRLAPGIIGTTQGAGAVKSSIYQSVKEQYLNAGASEEEAERRAREAQAYIGENADQIGLGAGLGALASTTGIEPAAGRIAGTLSGQLAGEAAERGAAGFVPRMLRGAAHEAPMEAAQGGQEQLASNIAEQREGFDTPTMQGVIGSAILEGGAGGIAGAGFGLGEAGVDRIRRAPGDGGQGAGTEAVNQPSGPGGSPAEGHPGMQFQQPIGQPQDAAPNVDQQGITGGGYGFPVPALRPSERMGINPQEGPISTAAAIAVDSGVSLPAVPGLPSSAPADQLQYGGATGQALPPAAGPDNALPMPDQSRTRADSAPQGDRSAVGGARAVPWQITAAALHGRNRTSLAQEQAGMAGSFAPNIAPGVPSGQALVPVSGSMTAPWVGAQESEADVSGNAGSAPRLSAGDQQAATQQAATESSQDNGISELGTGVFRVPVDLIKVDPDQYQFRTNVNAQGVDKRLAAVKRWDDNRAGTVLLHRRKDGSLYVADGHHRVDLAKRLGQPTINARIIDESAGIDVATARVEAAMNNIADGKAEPIDVAKVFRDSKVDPTEVRDRFNLPDNQVVRDGEAIAKLSDNVFGMVASGQLSEKNGAAIGSAFSDPGQQEAAADAFMKVDPQTEYQRQLLVNEIKAAEFAKTQGEQGGLFGDDPQEVSLMQHRLKILDALRQQLNADKRLFKTLNDNAEKASSVGNKIAVEQNEAITEKSARALDLIARVTTTPALNDAVNRAARRVFDGEPKSAVIKDLKKELMDYEKGDDGESGERSGAAPGGRTVNPERENGGRSESVPAANPPGADQTGQPEGPDEAAGEVKPEPAGEGEAEPDTGGAEAVRGLTDLSDAEYNEIVNAARYLKDFAYSAKEVVGDNPRAMAKLAKDLGKSGRDTLLMGAFHIDRSAAHTINNSLDDREPQSLRKQDMEEAFEIFPGLREIVDAAIARGAGAQKREEPTPAPEEEPALELTTQTEEELAEAERRREEAEKAELERKRQEELRAKADEEAKSFMLTGSDRPADVAMAAGQDDLFVASSRTEPTSQEPSKSKPGDQPRQQDAGTGKEPGRESPKDAAARIYSKYLDSIPDARASADERLSAARKSIDEAAAISDEALYQTISMFRKDPISRSAINEAFRSVAPKYKDSSNQKLAEIARELSGHNDKEDFKRSMLVGHDGDLAGVQLSSDDGKRGAIITPDPDENGKFRITYFDDGGVTGHDVRDNYDAILESAWEGGYRTDVSGMLEEFAGKDAFIGGDKVARILADMKDFGATYKDYLHLAKNLENPDQGTAVEPAPSSDASDDPIYTKPLGVRDVRWVRIGTPSTGVTINARISPEGMEMTYGTITDLGKGYSGRYETSDAERFDTLTEAKKHEIELLNNRLREDGYLADANESEPEQQVSQDILEEIGLLRQHRGKWQYRSTPESRWMTANSLEGATEMAVKAYRGLPESERLTRDQRFEKANREEYERMHSRYGKKSREEIEAILEKLGHDVSRLQQSARGEITDGRRSSRKATSAEAARQTAEERMRLERYYKERFGVAANESESQGSQKPEESAEGNELLNMFLNPQDQGQAQQDTEESAGSDLTDQQRSDIEHLDWLIGEYQAAIDALENKTYKDHKGKIQIGDSETDRGEARGGAIIKTIGEINEAKRARAIRDFKDTIESIGKLKSRIEAGNYSLAEHRSHFRGLGHDAVAWQYDPRSRYMHVAKDGVPFKTELAAKLARNRKDLRGLDLTPVEVDGGWALAPTNQGADSGSDTDRAKKRKPSYGKSNKIFTEEKAQAARERLRKKLGQLNSGLDPEMVIDGITLAGYHIEAGARKFADYARAMIEDLGEGVKPYLASWYEGVRRWPGFDSTGMTPTEEVDRFDIDSLGGTEYVPGSNADLEPDSGNAKSENRVGGDTVPDGSGRNAQDAGRARGAAEETRVSGSGDSGVSNRRAADGRKRGDQPVYSGDGELGSKERAAGSGDSGRGDQADGSGVRSGQGPSHDASEVAAEVKQQSLSKEARIKAQAATETKKLKIVPGDLENIAEHLPALLPAQQEDVAFFERRLLNNRGHGVLATNGTGTGKTFSGLGLVKRYVRMGRDNVIIVTPNHKIGADWIKSGKLLGLDIKALKDTKDNGGSGVVVTTYANFQANRTLVGRAWDLLVFDEAHYLRQSNSFDTTKAEDMRNALTGHPRGRLHYHKVRFADDYDRLKELSELIQSKYAVANLDDTMDVMADQLVAEAKALEKEKAALEEKLDKEYEKDKANRARIWEENKTDTLMLSATPFPYHFSVDSAEGYLFEYGQEDENTSRGYNAPDAREAFFMATFGYRKRFNKLTIPEAGVDTNLLEREFAKKLQRDGAMRTRTLEVDKDYDRRFYEVESGVGRAVDAGLMWLSQRAEQETDETLKKGFRDLEGIIRNKFDYLSRAYFLEAVKAKEMVPVVRRHLELGRKVVVFHDYNKGGSANPFDIPSMLEDNPLDDGPTPAQLAYRQFVKERPDLLNLPLDGLIPPIDRFKREFGDKALFFNGRVPKKEREEAVRKFNQDGSGYNLIVVQSDAGREGVSLHDTTGKHQRVLINLGLPVRPIAAIQTEGRIYRTFVKSNAIQRYVSTGLSLERWTIASKLATRTSTAENLAMGDQARGLKDSFLEAYEAAGDYPPGHEGEGTGGLERDRSLIKPMSDFERAKTYYFSRAKNTRRRSHREGADYYATPEPIGQKMVEWAGLKPGDKILEPSAGHGAILRWMNDSLNVHYVEPSTDLASQAAMHAPHAQYHHGTFEDLHLQNKFDAVVMNPPFGHGGATAWRHVAKAARHLRDGGRIVAIVPEGSASEKAESRFLDSDEAKDLFNVATIGLPEVTFERAGTKVKTKIVVLDKISDLDNAPVEKTRVSLEADTISDLFDLIEPIEIADKPRPSASNTADIKLPELVPAETRHAKKGIDLYVVKIENRIRDYNDFSRLRDLAKKHGGYYSSYNKAGAIPGFQFESESDRAAFLDEAAPVMEEIRGKQANDDQYRDHVGENRSGYGTVEARKKGYTSNPDQLDLFADEEELERLKEVDPYETMQQRSGTKPEQREAGRSALRDFFRQLNARLERRGLTEGGPGVSLLGAAIYRNFKQGKPNQLIGQTIREPGDLAALAQVYRDPRFETFRFIFVNKRGEVVGESGFTSRPPAAVMFDENIVDTMRDAMKRFGAHGYYMLHNHPSGRSMPSKADIMFTEKISSDVDGFRGHVVIDFNEYSVIDRHGSVETHHDSSLGSVDLWSNPDKPHDILGAVITNDRDVVGIGKRLQEPGRVVFIGTSAAGKVNLITSIDRNVMDGLSDNKIKRNEALAILRRMRRAAGSGGHSFLIVEDREDVSRFAPLIQQGAVTDVVSPDGLSALGTGMARFRDDAIMDRSIVKTLSVGENADPYQVGMSVSQARAIIDEIKAKWRNAPDIVVTDSISKLPQSLQDWISNTRPEGYIRAVYWRDRVYILANRIRSRAELEETLLHEVKGHYGLRKMLGMRIRPLLESVYRDMGDSELAENIKRAYYGSNFDASNASHRLTVAEEMLAHLAGSNNPRHRSLWRRIVSAVRQGLRRIGFQIRLRESDLLGLLDKSQKVVERGGIDTAQAGEDASLSDGGETDTGAGSDPMMSLDIKPSAIPKGVTSATIGKRITRQLKGRLADLKPAGLGALPLMYLRDFAPKNMTAIDQYMDEKRAMDADRNEMHTRYDAIAQRWLKERLTGVDLKTKVKILTGMGGGREYELDRLMHDATIAGVDPSIDTPPEDPSLRMQWALLRRRFEKLPESQQRLFEDVRDAYSDQIKAMEDAIEENIIKSTRFEIRRAERDYKAEVQRAKDELTGQDQESAIKMARRKYTRRVAAASRGESAKIMLLRKKFESMRIDRPYFPLKRFGDYFVALRDKEGNLKSFSMFERSADMDKAAEELARMYPDLEVKVGRKSNKEDIQGVVDPAFISDIQALLSDKIDDSSVLDAVYQMYLETLPDFSMRKNFIHRKKVPGYHRDALRAFASTMFHSSYQIARLRHKLEMDELIERIEEQANEADDPVDAMTVANEFRRRHEWVMNPTGGTLAQNITSLAFVYQLGITPAAALVNTTQTFMLGVPILGSRFRNEAGAMNHLLRASKDFVRGKGHIENVLSGDERKAFSEFMRLGLIDKTQSHDLAGVGETGAEYNAVRHKVMGIISSLFHHAERYNREVTSMAAYRMAREAGMSHKAAVKEATELTWMTHFDYSSGNRARYMQSDTARVLLVFRQHTVNMLARLVIDMRHALKGHSPEVRREAWRRLAGIYGMFAIGAGMLGVPGAQAVLMLLDAMDDDDDPWTAEDKIKRAVTEALGEDLAAAFFHGVPGTLLDLNLTDRIGMGNLWFFSPYRELEGRDAYYFWMEQVLGAAPAMIGNLFIGTELMKEGHIARGIETMLPKAGKDLMRAVRYSKEGVQSLNGYSIVDEVDAWGVIAQAIGFMPASVVEQYERNSALKSAEQHILNLRRNLLNRYALAIRTRDDDARVTLMAKISKFNRMYPSVAITSDTIRNSLMRRNEGRARARGGVLLDKRLEYLRRELAGENQ